MSEPDSLQEAERQGWRVVMFAAYCDDENRPGPTPGGRFDFIEVEGFLVARAKEAAR